MEHLLSELLKWSTLCIGIVWFAAGALLAWNRGIGAAVYFPALVGPLPALVLLQGAGSFQLFPHGSDPFAYIPFVFIPMAAAILGGHVSAAMNTSRRWSRESRIEQAVALRRLVALEQEVADFENKISRVAAPLHLVPSAAAAQADVRTFGRRELAAA